ncbi:acyl-CoA thioesterase [Streptomyces sp. NPDC102274]|uniref:acyl-CoA thioesterase n=1 Tax=Streptomyces sp. NPDC102274 TaxID=3366151 RepID=UPI0038221999
MPSTRYAPVSTPSNSFFRARGASPWRRTEPPTPGDAPLPRRIQVSDRDIVTVLPARAVSKETCPHREMPPVRHNPDVRRHDPAGNLRTQRTTMHTTRVGVRGYETDALGHLNGTIYLQYAEHSRWSLMRSAGIRQEDLLKKRIAPVNLETTIRYHRELKAGRRGEHLLPARLGRREVPAGRPELLYGGR